MSGDFPIIITKQYKEEATKWLDALYRGEDMSIVFFPKTDRDIRLGQLLSDEILLKNVLKTPSSFVFQPMNFDSHNVEDMEDLYFQIEERLNTAKLHTSPLPFARWMDHFTKHKLKLVIIIREAEKFLNDPGAIVLAVLSELVNKYSPLIRVISFFETDITHPLVFSSLPASSTLYENVFYFPLYPIDATTAFIDMLCRQWDVDMNRKMKDKIIDSCGGHFWLVKEAVRYVASQGSWTSEEEGLQFRLRSLYTLLLPTEQRVIEKLASGKKDFTSQEELSALYLSRMRVVDHARRKLLIGALRRFVYEHNASRSSIELKDNRILVNLVPVDAVFSRKEHRVIKLFLERKNQVLSRDEIAKSIWPVGTTEQYSDWAIDQLVARVRKRLVGLSLSPKLIKAIRGKGYQLV